MMTLTKVKDPKASFFADYKKMRFYIEAGGLLAWDVNGG